MPQQGGVLGRKEKYALSHFNYLLFKYVKEIKEAFLIKGVPFL
jgi:hypothetical protein